MKFKKKNTSLLLFASTVIWTLGTAPVAATAVYIYQQSDGSVFITDHEVPKKNFRLVKRYQTKVVKKVDNKRHDSTPLNDTPGPTTSSFDTQINNYAQLNKLDPALLKAVVQVESSFDPMATSKTGAMGLMQLMPDTAKRYGVSNSYDPEQNLAAGARYLRDLLDSFSENINLTLAAYNAGFENVRRFRGIPPFAETLRYIRKVTSLRSLYQKRS